MAREESCAWPCPRLKAFFNTVLSALDVKRLRVIPHTLSRINACFGQEMTLWACRKWEEDMGEGKFSGGLPNFRPKNTLFDLLYQRPSPVVYSAILSQPMDFRLILTMFRGGKMNNCLEEPLSPIVLFFVRSSRLFPHFRISTCINQKRHFPPLSNEGNEQTHLYGGIRRSRIPFSVHAFYRCSMQGERFTT